MPLFVLCAGVTGCTAPEDPGRFDVPVMDPDALGRSALALYDDDRDGAIASEELDRCPGMKRSVRQIDRDQDGRVTAAEIADRIPEYQADRIGLIGFIGSVSLNGEAL